MGTNVIIIDAARTLKEEIGFLAIVRDGRPAGAVSERDIVQKIAASDRAASSVGLGEIMSERFRRVGPTHRSGSRSKRCQTAASGDSWC